MQTFRKARAFEGLQRFARYRHRGWGLAVLAALAFVLAAVPLVRRQRAAESTRLTVSSGGNEKLSGGLLRAFVRMCAPHHLDFRPVATTGAIDALEQVEAGKLDFAFVTGGIDFSHYANIRQVTSLHGQPLHLLVKEHLAADVARHLSALQGKVVDLGGGEGATTYWLARDVMEFAGLDAGPDSTPDKYVGLSSSPADIAAMTDDRQLPDAVFSVTFLPSPLIRHLVEQKHYRLVALPFRDAFALGAMSGRAPKPPAQPNPHRLVILKERVGDCVIPAHCYQTDPPVPAEPLHTLGMSTLLVANRHVPSDAVERVLDALFRSRYAKIVQPPLGLQRLEETPELPWHDGSVAYLKRSAPVLTGELLSKLVNIVSIAGPLSAGIVFVRQWLRQRTRYRNERSFEAYIQKVCELEREATELDGEVSYRSAEVDRLRIELARLKSEALGLFTRGEIQSAELISSFLAHVNDARAHLDGVHPGLNEARAQSQSE